MRRRQRASQRPGRAFSMGLVHLRDLEASVHSPISALSTAPVCLITNNSCSSSMDPKPVSRSSLSSGPPPAPRVASATGLPLVFAAAADAPAGGAAAAFVALAAAAAAGAAGRGTTCARLPASRAASLTLIQHAVLMTCVSGPMSSASWPDGPSSPPSSSTVRSAASTSPAPTPSLWVARGGAAMPTTLCSRSTKRVSRALMPAAFALPSLPASAAQLMSVHTYLNSSRGPCAKQVRLATSSPPPSASGAWASCICCSTSWRMEDKKEWHATNIGV
mmetsp:Transcript_27108/g.73280  ORF Transcript_27108/g.73280 Transcript_27108/m.73280 type:complete len:276 (-) Transcript_27108:1263-2090(-)